ncbi:hypothetical protein Ndes2526B_g07007 [Nannochloris sp. 'desiccata']
MGNQPRQGRLKDIANLKQSPSGTISGLQKPVLDDATVDIGALMRKALQAPKLRNCNGGIPSNSYEAKQQHDEYDSNLGFRGNPLYSPEEASLAKAASKLENLHQKSISIAKNKTAATTPEAVGKLSKTAVGGQIPAHKPCPSEVATPGWRPAAQSKAAAADDIPLAARTLMAKRNRRKSVFQRPTRYGDWFDGDDDELEQMVDEFNGDEEAAREAHEEAKAQRKREKMEGVRAAATRRSKQAALTATSEEVEKERTATPLAASSGLPLISPTDMGTDIANKVRAIADGLCERLDGLIEESPALPRGAKRDDKSLRDKLLESWEGRSYYERLMQMAGGSAEQESLQAELEAAKAEGSMDSSTVSSDKEGSTAPGEQKPAAPTHALSFLSPPKPKMRMELAAALQRPLLPLAKDLPITAPKVGLPAAPAPAVVLPPATTTQPGKVSPVSTVNTTSQAPPSNLQLQLPRQQIVQQQHTQDISRGLLKVSARGSKPMPAPWQQGNEDDAAGTAAPVASASRCRDLAAKIIEEDEVEEEEEADKIGAGEKKNEEENAVVELEKLRAALAEMTLAKQAAENQAEDAKKALSEMEIQLEEAEEDLKTEATIRAAAEKRIHSLETEIATLQASSADAGGCQGTVLGKIVEDATEVNGKFGIVEAQLEALLAAANALSQQVSSGRVLTQTMVNNVTQAQAAAAQAGEEGKTRMTRARRKSAWRG